MGFVVVDFYNIEKIIQIIKMIIFTGKYVLESHSPHHLILTIANS